MDDSHLNHCQHISPTDDINRLDQYAEQPAIRQGVPEVISSGDRTKTSLPCLNAPAFQPAEGKGQMKVKPGQDGAKTSKPGLFAAAGQPVDREGHLRVMLGQDGANKSPHGLFAATGQPDGREGAPKLIWVGDSAKMFYAGLKAPCMSVKQDLAESKWSDRLKLTGPLDAQVHEALFEDDCDPENTFVKQDLAEAKWSDRLKLTGPLDAQVHEALFEDDCDPENTFVKQVFSLWSNPAQAGSGLGDLNIEHAPNVGNPDTNQIVTGFKMTVQVRRETRTRVRSDVFQGEDPDGSMEQPGTVSVRKQPSLHPLSQPRVSKKRAASTDPGASRPTRAAKPTQPKAKTGGTVVINGNPNNCQFLTTQGDAPVVLQQNYYIHWG